jgi:uncharacterized protein (TIGR00725 family)
VPSDSSDSDARASARAFSVSGPGIRALPILGVFGGSSATDAHRKVALAVGDLAARCGWVVLTGGGPGVMEAAARGAVEAGGVTLGLLPTAEASEGYPNPWIQIPVFTGCGSARNNMNALTAELCVAIGGGAGTVSEVALALKAGRDVLAWETWVVAPASSDASHRLQRFDSAGALLAALAERLAAALDPR